MRHKVKTALTPQEVLERAMVYFGRQGKGLIVVSESGHGLKFRKQGEIVDIRVKHGFTTTLELKRVDWMKLYVGLWPSFLGLVHGRGAGAIRTKGHRLSRRSTQRLMGWRSLSGGIRQLTVR